MEGQNASVRRCIGRPPCARNGGSCRGGLVRCRRSLGPGNPLTHTHLEPNRPALQRKVECSALPGDSHRLPDRRRPLLPAWSRDMDDGSDRAEAQAWGSGSPLLEPIKSMCFLKCTAESHPDDPRYRHCFRRRNHRRWKWSAWRDATASLILPLTSEPKLTCNAYTRTSFYRCGSSLPPGVPRHRILHRPDGSQACSKRGVLAGKLSSD